MPLKFGAFSEPKKFTYTSNEITQITVTGYEKTVSDATGNTFRAFGNFTAKGGARSMSYRIDGGSWQSILVEEGAVSGDWLLLFDARVLSTGVHEVEICLLDGQGQEVSTSLLFWYKAVELYFFNRAGFEQVTGEVWRIRYSGVYVVIAVQDIPWTRVEEMGIKVEISLDFDTETKTGTWQDITRNTNKYRNDFVNQSRAQTGFAIRISVPLPVPERLVIDGISYMMY